MLTGDCLFPTEQRFQAEFTNPQKEGTRSKKKLSNYSKRKAGGKTKPEMQGGEIESKSLDGPNRGDRWALTLCFP